MLDINAIVQAQMQEFPYRWIWLKNLLPPQEILELANSYPVVKFEESGVVSKIQIRLIVNDAKNINNIHQSQDLSQLWQQFLNDLCTTAYRNALETLTGLNLMNDSMYIYFFRYEPGNFFPPHPDADTIRMVQLFYFNQEWDASWGGCLRILKDENTESVHQEIPPLLNTSVILVKSDNSWHCVTPVTSYSPQSRRMLKVAFLKQEEYFAYNNNT